MKVLDKVWIHEADKLFPGIIYQEIAEAFIVLKFDMAIWRRVIIAKKNLSIRKNDFSEFMFNVRKNVINAPIEYKLPAA